jgi:sulfur-oxidizing protein SoxX
MRRQLIWIAVCGALAGCATPAPAPYSVAGDAIPAPLTAEHGNAERGRNVVAGRDANCLLCHAAPGMEDRFMGNLAPPLNGAGTRYGAGQLRLRIVDSSALNRNTIMPAYYRVTGLNQVAAAYRGKPILSAQQVEDVVAYLQTLH